MKAKKKDTLVSVVLNNYNYGKYLAACIESVLSQSYTNFEFIIVDDGSTDYSRNIIKFYKDKRIKTVFKKNGGQASAFNAGFSKCKGEVICFLDSDDWWKVHKLETIMKWHNFLEGKYSILQHNLDIWDSGKITPFKLALYSGDCFKHTVNTGDLGQFVGTSGLCFTKRILNKVFPVPEALRISADSYVTRTTFIFAPVYSIPESLGFYRKHQNAVFCNREHNDLLQKNNILFPALNQFYAKSGMAFRFTIRKDYGMPNLKEALMMEFLLKQHFEDILSTHPKIAIFGSGRHTEWLEKHLGRVIQNNVTAILDDNPQAERTFFGKPVVKAETWNPTGTNAILLSSDCHQMTMKERCRELFGDKLAFVDMYEGMAPGPYAKG